MVKQTFYESFSRLLSQNLTKFTDGRPLDKTTCLAIYETVFGTVQLIAENAELKISNECCNYVAQQFYDGILINNNQELDPNIFDKRARLENINNKDLVTMLALFEGTDFKIEVIEALKRRN